MKIFERIIERRVRERVNIDNMQFGFRPGKGTTDVLHCQAITGEVFGQEAGTVDGVCRSGEGI